jgi:wyosine [tRNA(Phe)-imidazoG37] synthetase (radical SAM superfamily)
MMEVEPRSLYKTSKILEKAMTKLARVKRKGEPVDYMTFVPDGEPTLDANLGEEIDALKELGIKIGVITNGSLLWREDVRHNLLKADWVSLKADAASEEIWRKVNKPHKSLKLETILQGMSNFARTFDGELTTETMLVRDVNDNLGDIKRIAEFLAVLEPARSYVAIPTRPPAEQIEPATEQTINATYQIFKEKLGRVEYLIGYEGNAFACTGDVQEDLLSITAVHPMREDAVTEFLKRTESSWEVVQHLINKRSVVEMEYQGKKFYMRKLPGHSLARPSRVSQNNK